jgi:hypothetical protein
MKMELALVAKFWLSFASLFAYSSMRDELVRSGCARDTDLAFKRSMCNVDQETRATRELPQLPIQAGFKFSLPSLEVLRLPWRQKL